MEGNHTIARGLCSWRLSTDFIVIVLLPKPTSRELSTRRLSEAMLKIQRDTPVPDGFMIE